MRITKALRLLLAASFASVPASAGPVLLRAPEIAATPVSCPLTAPAAGAAVFVPLSVVPALLVPPPPAASIPSAPRALQPAPAGAAGASRPLVVRALASVPATGDEPGAPPGGLYARFFDGVAPAEEGAAVYPKLALGPSPTFRQPVQADVAQHAVRRALAAVRESVALGQWNGPHTTLDESCCGDAAPKLAVLLRAQGVPARLVEAEFHYYLILDLPDGQLVVDPTVRQFFGRKKAPRSVPQVFVGSIAELNALFQRHAASKTTRYDASRVYFSQAVVREDALLAYDAKVRAGGPADLEPLRRFLGIPPTPPAPPRLITP